MFKYKLTTIVMLLSVALLTSACSFTLGTSGSKVTSVNGGLYKSIDSGDRWKQQSIISSVNDSIVSFASANITAITLDPGDNEAVYLGTHKNGMLYSYDGAKSWQVATNLGQRAINDVKVSPADRCSIYVATENKIYKSIDCSRNWKQIYFDNEDTARIISLAIDPVNSAIVYAGTSRGELIQSANGGKSWSTKYRFNPTSKNSSQNSIVKVIINPSNVNNIWVATDKEGIYSSADKGRIWTSYKEEFLEINKKAIYINDIAVSSNNSKQVVVATDSGLIKSADLGGHWRNIEVIPPSKGTTINRVALSADDANIIYYATDTSLGVSKDNGQTWESKKLPSKRYSSALALDYKDSSVVYLGVFYLEQ